MRRYTPATKSSVNCDMVYQRLPLARVALSRGDSLLRAAILINCCTSCLDQATWCAIGRRTS